MPHYIYTLVDPRDSKPFYVGRTNNPQKRLSAHINGRNKTKNTRCGISTTQQRICEIVAAGLKPRMEVLEQHEELIRARYREVYMMHKYGRLYDLTNSSGGISGFSQSLWDEYCEPKVAPQVTLAIDSSGKVRLVRNS